MVDELRGQLVQLETRLDELVSHCRQRDTVVDELIALTHTECAELRRRLDAVEQAAGRWPLTQDEFRHKIADGLAEFERRAMPWLEQRVEAKAGLIVTAMIDDLVAREVRKRVGWTTGGVGQRPWVCPGCGTVLRVDNQYTGYSEPVPGGTPGWRCLVCAGVKPRSEPADADRCPEPDTPTRPQPHTVASEPGKRRRRGPKIKLSPELACAVRRDTQQQRYRDYLDLAKAYEVSPDTIVNVLTFTSWWDPDNPCCVEHGALAGKFEKALAKHILKSVAIAFTYELPAHWRVPHYRRNATNAAL